MTHIFFQNGMQNNYDSALASAKLIKELTNQDVGLIVNSTAGSQSNQAGYLNDVSEYLPSTLYLKDALTGEVYQQIAANSNSNTKSLIIMHSAGNEDARKSAEILKLNNVNLNNKIDFISVGSPISQAKLQNSLTPVGGNLIGQYNNILDPVTNSKTWAALGVTSLGVGAYYGATVGIGMTATGTGLEAFGSGLVGGGAIVGGIKFQHPFEKYFNKDFKNLKTDIKSWSENNK